MILAHGVGVRSDLPIPLWLFVDAAAAALVISFLLLGLLWRRPLLATAAQGRSVRLPPTLATTISIALRTFGLATFGLVLAAALFGSDSSASNPAPRWFYVVFWVGVPLISFVTGDVWKVLSPFDSLAAIGQGARDRRLTGTPTPNDPGEQDSIAFTHWPALIGLVGFLWLELAYHEPDSPRVIGVAMGVYAVGIITATAKWGRAWLRTGEGFTVLFHLIAAMSPIEVLDGRLRIRVPFSGLATLPRRRGLLGVVLVVLGGTAFDGFSRTSYWKDVIGDLEGWTLTALNTIGLVWMICVVTVLWTVASRISARLVGRDPTDRSEIERYATALVPIVLAYAIAHYFSLFYFEAQTAIAQISDPFAKGADIFGTIDWQPDYTSLSPDLISYVQVFAIVIGHVAGVTVAHDQAEGELSHRLAIKSQYPYLAVMVAYTVAGLLLLLNA
ncbi:MAG TPA: hypothetical protein VMW08_16885 [Acidimicrobiales bacterium]|nr:hypothetical protein [Acidimicrobiales bacterium]